ncbi:hypothetical protein [Luteolibacter sp. LG18]|uniref:hypothetical protein n=1 Tax=Luteolibacter sp. LG18 TaxID=2819286 RepID=UPI002B3245ED|nr:hypothetical protein llg_41840 [Luteolibacter sp. LG18]
MKIPALIACAAVLLGMVAPAFSQDAAPASSPEASPKRYLRFTALGKSVSGDVFYEAGGQKVPVFASAGCFSQPLPLPKDKALHLFREIPPPPNAPAGAKPQRQEVGAVEITEGTKLLVVLVPPQDITKEKIQGRSYKDSYQSHGGRTARVFNVSPKEILFRSGQKGTLQLEVGGNGVVPFEAVAYGSAAYQIAIRGTTADAWKLAENAEAAAPSNYRFFIFVAEVIDTDGKKIITSAVISDPVPENSNEDTSFVNAH